MEGSISQRFLPSRIVGSSTQSPLVQGEEVGELLEDEAHYGITGDGADVFPQPRPVHGSELLHHRYGAGAVDDCGGALASGATLRSPSAPSKRAHEALSGVQNGGRGGGGASAGDEGRGFRVRIRQYHGLTLFNQLRCAKLVGVLGSSKPVPPPVPRRLFPRSWLG